MTGIGVSLAIALVLVLVQIALVARAAEMKYPGDRLEPLCEGKVTNLTLRSHLNALLEQADDLVASGKCSEHIHQALKDLKQLLGSKNDAVCNMDKVEDIKAYYLKYLDTSSGRGEMEGLPRSLIEFVLGYGMQVSNLCKIKTIHTFQSSSVDQLIGDWRIRPNDLLSSDSSLSKLMKSASKQVDNILLPSHLGEMLQSTTELKKQLTKKMLVNSYALRKKAICERRYRPIYEQNFLPVTVLASIGFDYMDSSVKDYINPDNMKYWSRMVFVCELISAIEFEDKSGGANGKNADIEVIKGDLYDKYTVGNVVYDQSNAKLLAKVKSFQTDKSEAKRAEEFILKLNAPWLFISKLKASLKKAKSPRKN